MVLLLARARPVLAVKLSRTILPTSVTASMWILALLSLLPQPPLLFKVQLVLSRS